MNTYYNLVDNGKVPGDVESFLKNPFKNIPSIEVALEISKKYGISLHPRFLFYWNELTSNQLIGFLEALIEMKIESGSGSLVVDSKIKAYFENLAIEHSYDSLKSLLVIDELNLKILFVNLGISLSSIDSKSFVSGISKIISVVKENLSLSSLEIINLCSYVEIRDKAGSYIGARMGRPEKAKMRKMDGRPYGLFPVGDSGGKLKNIMVANEKSGTIESLFGMYYCPNCDYETIYSSCDKCGIKCEDMYFEKWTDIQVKKDHEKAVRYKKGKIDLNKYLADVRKILGVVNLPKMVKGIEETTNRFRLVEHLSKAFLREKNGVYVNKDGTIRFDMIEMGLTHFRPFEIGVSVEKLKELGYLEDSDGNPLVSDDQLVEILPQDVILPDCVESGDELASDFVIKTGNFVDDELEKLYGLPRFYNFKTKEDTIGHLLIGLAPHTSAGIVGRILGYSNTQGCFSHPVWHAAQRRNLDGDENGVMLLVDGLINFSREYLPDRRGSRTMDTSLVLTSHLYLDQIDDEVHGMDIVDHYPLEFYKINKEYASPKSIKIEKVEHRIDVEDVDSKYLGYKFTHNTTDMNNTVMCSSYKSVPSMGEKMDLQLKIGTDIRAVDEDKVGTFIIDKHFMKDIKGNLRKFSMQKFRCTKCNISYRRPPLNGKCTKCREPNINFTIHEGSIKKYLKPSFDIVNNYDVDPYIVETLELANLRVEGVFGKEGEQQKSLSDFFGKK